MNTEALFLFLILLLGLVLCSFLGGNCGYEGFNTISEGLTTGSGAATSTSGAATSPPVNGDNYNHASGSMTSLQGGSILYGPNNAQLIVEQNSDGTQSLNVTLPNGKKVILKSKKEEKKDSFKKTDTSSDKSYTNFYGATTFYGPDGFYASIIKGNNGQIAIHVETNQGDYTFTPDANYYNPKTSSNTNTNSSTQYYGSTGYQLNTYQGAYSPYDNNQESYSNQNNGRMDTASRHAGKSPFFDAGPEQNTVAGSTSSTSGTSGNNEYASSLPPGIPASQIPAGQEDLYILKSQVVPPICPNVICPSIQNLEEIQAAKCPPCKPCGRCPEPSFECKKVPNYNSIGNNELPIPVLNNFSTFGM